MTTGRILLDSGAKAPEGVRSATRVEGHARTLKYKGYVIVARPYQLHDSKHWTVELDLRRSGRRRSFSGPGRCRTQAEAEAMCFSMGRRLIDGGIPDWSMDPFRDDSPRWFAWRQGSRPWTGRPFVKVSAIVLSLAAYVLLEGGLSTSEDAVLPSASLAIASAEQLPIALWVAAAGLLAAAVLVVSGARRAP